MLRYYNEIICSYDVAPMGLVGCRLYEAVALRAKPRGTYIHQLLVSASLDEQLMSGAEGCIFTSTFHITSQAVAQPHYNNNH